MSLEVLNIRDFEHIPILNSFENLSLVIYKNGNGKLGFNESNFSQKILFTILTGGFMVNRDGIFEIIEGNSLELSKINKEPFGVVLHEPTPVLLEMIKKVNLFLKKNKQYCIKNQLRPNIFSPPIRPREADFFMWFDSNYTCLEPILKLCGYMTFWPLHWGVYGQHFYVSYCDEMEIQFFLTKKDWNTGSGA